MRNRSSSIIIGLIFVALGVGFFVDQLGINLGFSILSFWPFILILIGIYLLLRSNIFAGLLLTGIGVTFFISEFTGVNIFAVCWPLIIIFIGLSILFKPTEKHWMKGSTVSSDTINESVTLWGADWNITSKNFRGGKIDAFLGGFKLDLRDAEIASGGAVLVIGSVLGGGEIYVPESMRIEVKSEGALGAWENNFKSSQDTTKPLLTIKGSSVLGGVEVKN